LWPQNIFFLIACFPVVCFSCCWTRSFVRPCSATRKKHYRKTGNQGIDIKELTQPQTWHNNVFLIPVYKPSS
jgi:hypothetical protein